jgi:hypothetical protein
MNKRIIGDLPHRLSRLALAAVLTLPLLAACGEEEVAEEPVAPAETTTGNTGNTESPAGVPSTLDSTGRAIEAVPPANSNGQ